jgi:hypothetical protein
VSAMIGPTSRYAAVETATFVAPDGRELPYLRRRVVPQPERLAPLGEHVVAPGERLDVVAAQALGDPEQFWRIADANRALDPRELTTPVGRRLRITLPEGVPGVPDA